MSIYCCLKNLLDTLPKEEVKAPKAMFNMVQEGSLLSKTDVRLSARPKGEMNNLGVAMIVRRSWTAPKTGLRLSRLFKCGDYLTFLGAGKGLVSSENGIWPRLFARLALSAGSTIGSSSSSLWQTFLTTSCNLTSLCLCKLHLCLPLPGKGHG